MATPTSTASSTPARRWLYQASGTAVLGGYCNLATATGAGAQPATDPACYTGVAVPPEPVIAIVKRVNGADANSPAGPSVTVGATVTWTYTVTNPGSVPVASVAVSDDNGTADPGDDFNPAYVSGDTNLDGLLDPGESWLYQASGTAVLGGYCNLATATGAGAQPATDPACYTGVAVPPEPVIAIVKRVNGADANSPAGPSVTVGATVTWTYTVTNPGSVPVAAVAVSDDNGTPADPGDDFNPAYVSGDTNLDGLLDPGETWPLTRPRGRPSWAATATSARPPAPGAHAGDRHRPATTGVVGAARAGHRRSSSWSTAPTPTAPPAPSVTGRQRPSPGPTSVTNPGTVPVADGHGQRRQRHGRRPGRRLQPRLRQRRHQPRRPPGPRRDAGPPPASGTAVPGGYCNLATATGSRAPHAGRPTRPATPACRRRRAGHRVVKLVNGADADSRRRRRRAGRRTVTWTYMVTNPGNVPVLRVTVTDDNGTPADPGDDFDRRLRRRRHQPRRPARPRPRRWLYQATGTPSWAATANLGTATGAGRPAGAPTRPATPACRSTATPISRSSSWSTAPTPTARPARVTGRRDGHLDATWSTNPGTVPVAGVAVGRRQRHRRATRATTSTPTYVSGDTDLDGLLDLDRDAGSTRPPGRAVLGGYCNLGTATGTGAQPTPPTRPATPASRSPPTPASRSSSWSTAPTPTARAGPR